MKALYDKDNKKGCFYNSILKTIFITGRHPKKETEPHSYASWDVIMHEYGHHIQNELNTKDSVGDGHSSSTNMSDHYKMHYVNNNFTNCGIGCILYKYFVNFSSLSVTENECKREGDKIAWGESWPTVFGLMAQNYYSAHLTNIDTVANTLYQSYNGLNYCIETTTVKPGEACERSIMAVLWDIFDSNNDTYDTISLGHEAFWDISTREGTYTFSDFMNIFYAEYPEYIDHSCRYETTDTTHSYICNDCGYTETKSHNFVCDGEENSWHYERCADCGYRVNQWTQYQYSNISATQHTKLCTDCGTSITENHDYKAKIKNATEHSLECDCGATNGTQGHIWTSYGIGKVKCDLCGFIKILAPGEFIPIIKNKEDPEEETE